jgi:hypothetical protein
MKSTDVKIIGVGIIGIAAIFLLIWIFSIGYINNSPGLYKYSVDIEGLNNYQPSLITDIIVPIPMRDSEQVFADDELQYQKFGNWKTVLVVTKYGKMLAFESVGRNLTDIHAVFYRKYPGGTRIKNITSESLSPVLPVSVSPYSQPIGVNNSLGNYSTIVYIPDTIRPLHAENDLLTFNIELSATEGMQHSQVGSTYHVEINEKIPPGVYNMTEVLARVSSVN